MRATELSVMLGRNADAVVRMLLPHGRRVGDEWRVGSVDGEAGRSMGVHMAGEKAGVWMDGATGESGDFIGLWMAVRGLSLRDACKEAADYLGIREERLDPPRKVYSKPTKQGVAKLSQAHKQWLEVDRGISTESVTAYKLASKGDELMFPYLRDGELVAAKYRRLPKQFRQDKDCEPSLFGWQAIPDTAREVVICEGELDALAWHSYGFPALSVPMGGGTGAKHSWIETEFDRLSLFDVIYVSMDSDKAGQDAMRDIVERLGRERCRVVTLPFKDANDCLMQDVPKFDMVANIREARTLDPSELRPMLDFEDAIVAEYDWQDHGINMPWPKADKLKLRPGETSVWAGINGHGKSTVVSFIVGMAASAPNPAKCCVASMEYRTSMWMMRMNRQLSGTGKPTAEYSREITRTVGKNIWAFEVTGAAKSTRLLEVFAYARKRYAIDLFVIDNLTKCGFADDDYAGQKLFIEKLSDFARDTQCHVIVVAHMRKGEDESKPSGKFGVKGSGGITDMADTVVEVWRNKPKEKAVDKAGREGVELDPKWDDKADAYLFVHKQRATGEEPAIGLHYHVESTQYLSSEKHQVFRPVPYSIKAVANG